MVYKLTIVFIKYRKYNIKDYSSGKTLKIRLCDTRGIEEDFAVDTQEMAYILNGNIPDRYQVNSFRTIKNAKKKNAGLNSRKHLNPSKYFFL